MNELYRDFVDSKANEIINDLGGTITPAPSNDETYREFLDRKFDDVINALPSSPSSEHTYSTEEQIIGKWIDGTNVYEKTFVGKMSSSSTNCDIPFDGFGETQAVLSINGIFDDAVPFNMQGAKSSYVTVSSLHPYTTYGYWGSAGIRVSRQRTGLYSASPNVVVTVQYLKNI